LDKQISLSKYAGAGGWNDPDMLEVGNGQMTNDEYQSHFALWAALKAPLLIGCGLTGITQSTLTILGNEEVIAVNQDPLGRQADLISHEESATFHRQIWGGELSKNRLVYVCFNRHTEPSVFRLDFGVLLPTVKIIAIREIIDHVDIKVPTESYFWTKTVKSHAVAMYIVEYRTL
jgi:alpha-galactosidase